ncbi:putative uncharacterized protein DDB_G0271606, partial [Drosophila serrata]|uniref:putative uncharacterized protein DDB_G0271606 n=1 Tax=Drosophila serrata TaxID=7274 RepID=UPI000A1D07A3
KTSAKRSCFIRIQTNTRTPAGELQESNTNTNRSWNDTTTTTTSCCSDIAVQFAISARSDDTSTGSSASTGEPPPPPPPDATYNDAVRRIRSAHSCEQLRHLVQRQLERHRLPWRSNTSGNNDEALANELRGSQSSDHADYKLNIHKSSGESPQRRQLQGASGRAEQVQVDFYAYLQLASGYYERGLQADLKYLQSIGQQQQHKQQQRRCNAIKPLDKDLSHLSQRSESPVQRLTGRLVTLLKSLRRKAENQKRPSHPEIRVDIRSVKREQQQQQDQDTDVEEEQEPEQEQEQEQEAEEEEEEELEELDSMCDYYAPAAAATTEATEGLEGPSRASVVASVATTAHQRRLYEIIDNLSHLSIAGDTTAAGGVGGGGGGGTGSRRQHLQLTLPQITLTDCSTTAQQVALYSNSITLQMMPNNEARAT